MMNMEDRLWDYIDGLCSPEERNTISQLLQSDTTIRRKYDELLSLHQQLKSVELDEPGMGFKNRVMEQVLAGPHPSTLKTKVDHRIIYSIAAFFVLTIGGMLAYAISKMDWSASQSFELPEMSMPAVNWSFLENPAFTLFFLAVNVVLGLVLIDKLVTARRKNAAKVD
ncbi:MAG: hypothetical protein IPO83_07370 [Chitinophagaceae bacterium]|nr:hypothetical protein [Chitinophagaceae bacterium]